MDRPTCETCPHFLASVTTNQCDGFCLRYPRTPVAVPIPGDPYTGFGRSVKFHSLRPEVDRDDSCGEHPNFQTYQRLLKIDSRGAAPVPFDAENPRS